MNAAEVIDKYASQIADAVKQAAPQVWDAAWKQAVGIYVITAVCLGMGALIGACVAVYCKKALAKSRAEDDHFTEGEMVGFVLGLVAAAGFGIGAIGNLLCAYYVAPMAAIQSVVGLVKP